MSNNENSHRRNQTEKSKMTWIEKEGDIEEFQISKVPKVKSVTIPGTLLDEMTKYSKDAMPREAIGLLGGKELRANELMISKILFVTEGNETSVSFSDEDFSAFEEILENKNFCLGWWHSHPGYGLFLSQTDINTHIFSFQLHNALSVALVIEPSKIDMNGRALFQFYQVVREQGKKPRHQEIASYIR
ncbi:MAG: Mov34/MPN/PAD-1 family protein [Promethearchaeota archaeon]